MIAAGPALSRNAACAGCGESGGKVFLDRCTDRLHGCPGEWSLIECETCRLISLSPMPADDEIAALYPPSYGPYHSRRPLTETAAGAFLRRLIVFPYTCRFGPTGGFERPFGGGRMLDIGCGSGMLLRRMTDLGWRGTGLDTSPVAADAARRNAPEADIRVGTMETAALTGRFDWIVMNHVLEHLPSPSDSLTRCFRLLASGGVLQVAVPNIQGFEEALFGRYWIGLDVPRHLTHFREPVLLEILQRCGFEIVSSRPQLFPSSLSESLLLMLPDGLRRRAIGSRLARSLYLACVFPAALACLLGNRSVIEVRARKPADA